MRELRMVQTSCSLSESDRQKRAEEIVALAPDVQEHSRRGDSLTLLFTRDDSIQRRIEGLIAKESECCPFLGFDLELRDDSIQLELTAPKESIATLDAFERLLST